MNLFDDFNRADNVNGLAGSTLSGGGAIWEKVKGTANAGITNGQAIINNSFFGTLIVAQSNSIEGSLVYTRTATNADVDFIFRYIDVNNYLTLRIQGSGNLQLYKRVANVETQLASVNSISIGITVKIAITAAHQITLWKNGVQEHTSVLDAALNTGTKHGFSTYEAVNLLDSYDFVDSSIVVASTGTDTAPVNTVPAAQSAFTNIAKAITGISVNDPNGNLASTKITASSGNVKLSDFSAGAIISAGGNDTSTVTLSGTQTQINSVLASLSYINTLAGNFTITVLSTDKTATPLTDTDTIAVTVTAASPPVNAVPAAQTVLNNTDLAITGVSVNDADGNLASTKLTVLNGTITVSLAGGATISAGVNNSATLTLIGTQTQINAALGTISYKSNLNFSGADTLTVFSSDSSSTPLTDSDNIAITVTTQTAPVNTVPATQNAGVNVAKSIAGVSVTDAENNLATTKLTATGGTIYLSLLGGATISAGANNSSTLTLSGTQTQINAALSTLGYIGTVLGNQTITVLSTDTTGTPLTDTDVIAITVKDAYAVDNTAFNVTGVLSNGVSLDSNKKWVIPTGTTSWTFTVQKLAAEHTAPIGLNLSGVASAVGASNGTINPATNVFITEAAYPLLNTQQQTDVETVGGGYPLFIVTKNIGDTTNAFDVTMSLTKDGTYTTYLSNQAFTPTATVTGNIDRNHPAFSISNESNMPTTITAGTKSLLYDTAGQIEWLELSDLSTRTDGLGTNSIRLLNASKTAIWDIPMPIAIDIDQVGRIALLTNPVVGTTVLADGAQRFFKIIPKVIGGASVNPALVTPISLMITSRSRKPFPVRDVRFSRNNAIFGSAFPENDLDQGDTNIFVYPSSRTETVTSGFFSPSATFETGVTAHVDVKTVGGETLLRSLTATNGINATYTEAMRTADIQRYSTQYEVYTKKNGIESARFIHVVKQRITLNNDVTNVATTIVASNVRGAVTLRATEGGTSGTGQETAVYDVVLSGTLFPTINMDTMTIEGNAATILSYDNTNGRLEVVAPRSLTGFVLIIPFTGTGTISIFAGTLSFVNQFGGISDIGFTGSATQI